MSVFNHINRDSRGESPKMLEISQKLSTLEGTAPYLKIVCEDNLMSDISIHGSFNHPSEWSNNIWHNSDYFLFMITPPKRGRWYSGGDVQVELTHYSHTINRKFRKYTGAPDKVIEKISQWIRAGK